LIEYGLSCSRRNTALQNDEPNTIVDSGYRAVVDLENYSLIRLLPLQGGGQSWGHVVDAQGMVYVTIASYLYL
jgi:hypothetical protein